MSFRIRSYGRRMGRSSTEAKRALSMLFPQFGLKVEAGLLQEGSTSAQNIPCYVEIGFGSGRSLLALAKQHPTYFFIGIETYQSAVASLLLGIEKENLTNLRVYNADVFDVFEHCTPPVSLDGVQIFFPDPWPKRRHHGRRLIQSDFLLLLASKLKPNGVLHLATDWEHYAKQMMQVLSASDFVNASGPNQFAKRSPLRPVITKFEQRALREERAIWELQFYTR